MERPQLQSWMIICMLIIQLDVTGNQYKFTQMSYLWTLLLCSRWLSTPYLVSYRPTVESLQLLYDIIMQ